MKKMKKMLIALIALLVLTAMALPCAQALADGAAAEPWYELSADNAVLTVRLPGNTKTGLTWSFEIERPEDLELLTHETLIGESEGMAGTPTTYVASFRVKDSLKNDASLILHCGAEGEDPVYTRVIQLNTTADNKMTINSVLEKVPYVDWCEYNPDGYLMTVRLPGDDWNFEIIDTDKVDLLTCSEENNEFAASFIATAPGYAEIYFTTDDEMSTRIVSTFVSENCQFFSNYATTQEFFVKTPAEPQTTEFKTVTITGNSVNMRKGATTGSDVITVLKKDMSAKYLNETKTSADGAQWHKISYKGSTGWISAKYSKIGGQGYVKIINGDCNVRTLPTTESGIITTLKKSTVVKSLGEGITDERGVDWYKISASGKDGWVSSKFAEFSTAPGSDKPAKTYKYVLIKGGDCTMRKKADKDSSRIDILPEGLTVSFLGEQQNDDRGVAWYYVSYNGQKGWVSSKYAKLTNSKGDTPSPTPTPEKEETDMRLVLNPNRYDVLCVTDIFSLNGRDYYVDGYFGTINKYGECEYFDQRKTVRMELVYGAEVLLPENLNNPEDIDYVDDPAIWFNNARKNHDGQFLFYATFSMNESGALRNLVYRHVL